MHDIIYKIQKTQIFPIIKLRSPTIQESQKVELEILIGQGLILKNPTTPFPPSKHKKPNYSSFFLSKPPPHPWLMMVARN